MYRRCPGGFKCVRENASLPRWGLDRFLTFLPAACEAVTKLRAILVVGTHVGSTLASAACEGRGLPFLAPSTATLNRDSSDCQFFQFPAERAGLRWCA
jgi:hypothetical protein